MQVHTGPQLPTRYRLIVTNEKVCWIGNEKTILWVFSLYTWLLSQVNTEFGMTFGTIWSPRFLSTDYRYASVSNAGVWRVFQLSIKMNLLLLCDSVLKCKCIVINSNISSYCSPGAFSKNDLDCVPIIRSLQLPAVLAAKTVKHTPTHNRNAYDGHWNSFEDM